MLKLSFRRLLESDCAFSRMYLNRKMHSCVSAAAGSTSCEAVGSEAERLVSSIKECGSFGKPYIPGFAPFSVSHSGCTWAVLIDDDIDDLTETGHACGLDIQYSRKVDADSVAERFFAREDAAVITGANSPEEARRRFFRLWARREALIKALGGSVADTGIPAVNSSTAEHEGEKYYIRDIDIPGEGLYAAACTRREMNHLRILEL